MYFLISTSMIKARSWVSTNTSWKVPSWTTETARTLQVKNPLQDMQRSSRGSSVFIPNPAHLVKKLLSIHQVLGRGRFWVRSGAYAWQGQNAHDALWVAKKRQVLERLWESSLQKITLFAFWWILFPLDFLWQKVALLKFCKRLIRPELMDQTEKH